MAMFVWPDDTVTGSVNVAELEAIQKGLKGVGKRKLANLPWPIESAEQLTEALAGGTDDDDTDEPEPPKAAKATEAKADPKADETAKAMSKVDLPAALGKSTTKKGTS